MPGAGHAFDRCDRRPRRLSGSRALPARAQGRGDPGEPRGGDREGPARRWRSSTSTVRTWRWSRTRRPPGRALNGFMDRVDAGRVTGCGPSPLPSPRFAGRGQTVAVFRSLQPGQRRCVIGDRRYWQASAASTRRLQLSSMTLAQSLGGARVDAGVDVVAVVAPREPVAVGVADIAAAVLACEELRHVGGAIRRPPARISAISSRWSSMLRRRCGSCSTASVICASHASIQPCRRATSQRASSCLSASMYAARQVGSAMTTR